MKKQKPIEGQTIYPHEALEGQQLGSTKGSDYLNLSSNRPIVPNIRSDQWKETSIIPVFSKLKWWERLIGRDPKFKGFHCYGYVTLTGNTLSYVSPGDVITLDGVGEWLIQHCAIEFGEQWYRVNTVKPLQFKWPINYSAIVIKLYSTRSV